MTTDPIVAAIDHIRSITPADGPWTPAEFAAPGHDPTPTDRAIATILNAVVSGQLINRASRDEMLAQIRRGDGLATAGAEARWIVDTEAGVYDTDAPDPIAAARALIESRAAAGAVKVRGQWIETADTLATLADAVAAERAENQRLREALLCMLDYYEMGGAYSDQYSRRARAALRSTEASHD